VGLVSIVSFIKGTAYSNVLAKQNSPAQDTASVLS